MIFVTGGTGLVGAHLLVELAKKQQPIRALKRKTSNTATVQNFFAEQNASQFYQFIHWIDGDLLDVTELPNLLDGIETIYHAAAFVSFDERQEEEIFNTNILGTETLVNEAIDSGVKEFFFISSIASMDDLNPATKMIDERSGWNNSLTHSSYSISKFRAEMEVWRASQEGIKVITVLVERELNHTYGNHADDNVHNYLYDYVIDNTGTLKDLGEAALTFMESLITQELLETLVNLP